MKNLIKILATAASAASIAVSGQLLAADWTIQQTATVATATPSLRQGDTALVTDSVQAINGIALKTDEDSVVAGSSQLVTISASTSFNLTQGELVANSTQAANYLEAQNVGTTSGAAVTQTVTSTSTATTLTQEVAAGGGSTNLQALNVGRAAARGGTINNLTQSITEAGTLSLIQNAVVTGTNSQAVNFAFGETIGVDGTNLLTQSVTVTGATTFTQQAPSDGNNQGGNIAAASDSGNIGSVSQTFITTTDIGLEQSMSSGQDNIQAINFVDTSANSDGTVGTVTQMFTANGGTVTFLSNATGIRNTEAGNFVDTRGSITDLTQSFDASNSALVDFDQTGAGNNNIQAGNMARTIDTGAIIAEIAQIFTGSTTTNDFNQNSAADALIQAGNLIRLGYGGISDASGPHQTFTTTGTVNMTQLGGGTSNLQALNAVTDFSGGTASVNLHQALITTGTSFAMAQNAVTTSGQFGNYAGETF